MVKAATDIFDLPSSLIPPDRSTTSIPPRGEPIKLALAPVVVECTWFNDKSRLYEFSHNDVGLPARELKRKASLLCSSLACVMLPP